LAFKGKRPDAFESQEWSIPLGNSLPDFLSPRWFMSLPVGRIKQEGGIAGIGLFCLENETGKSLWTAGLMES
jgi:hypothetical protein